MTGEVNAELDPQLIAVMKTNRACLSGDGTEIISLGGVPKWYLRRCCEETPSLKFDELEGGLRISPGLRLTKPQIAPLVSNAAVALLKVCGLRMSIVRKKTSVTANTSQRCWRRKMSFETGDGHVQAMHSCILIALHVVASWCSSDWFF